MVGRSRIRLIATVFFALALIPLTATGPAAAGGTAAPIVRQDVKHDLSAPLRSITPSLSPETGTVHVPFMGRPTAASRPANSPNALDPVVQTSAPTVQMPAPATSFDGIGVAGYLPSDSNSDVGPNHIVETVNSRFQIFDKTGTSLLGPSNINTLFSGVGGACETNNDGDPIVLYDQAADRWLISQFAIPGSAPYYQCVAISQTPDPTGSWYRYVFDMGSNMNDYFKFGVWRDGYYMTDNEFDLTTIPDTFVGVGVYAFDRSAMLTGAAATYVGFHLPSPYFGLLPGDIDGSTLPPAGAPNTIVGFDDATDFIDTWAFLVDWAVPANSTLTGPVQLAAAPFDTDLCGYSRHCIPQPDGAVSLDTVAGGMMYRLAYRNFGDHESLVMNFTVDYDGNDNAGIRWTELRKTPGPWSIYQEGTYTLDDGDHRWMGSIAQDQNGDIALGYSVSSGTTYPSIRYAGRLASDPLNQLSQAEATMQAGGGSQTHASGRWGDYTSMAVDPSDDCTFWYTNQYYSATSSATWRTRIGSFKFPTCPQQPLTVNTSGVGSVTSDLGGIDCPGTCSANFDNGQSVQLTAHPAAGSIFSGWSGDCTGSTNPCSVSMTQARSVTATFVPCTYRPDGQIRGGPADLTYLGNDVYNHDGFGQTLQRLVRPGFGDQFNIKMENDGNCVDSFLVHGAGSSTKFKITYWSGALNVTPAVVAGTFQTPVLDPGESAGLLAFIYAKRGLRQGTTVTDPISVASWPPASARGGLVPNVWDVVGARLKVDRRAGDFGSQFPIP